MCVGVRCYQRMAGGERAKNRGGEAGGGREIQRYGKGAIINHLE